MTTTSLRNRDATEARLIQAVGSVLAREGFAKIGVNTIAREANVDKVLIYRYFDGLPGLLTAWAQSGAFWPPVQELIAASPANLMELPFAERYALFFAHFIDSLRARPLTIEILEAQREQWGEEVGRTLAMEADYQQHPELIPLTNLLNAGVQNLLIRARSIRYFGGLDIQSDGGWRLIKESIQAMARKLLAT